MTQQIIVEAKPAKGLEQEIIITLSGFLLRNIAGNWRGWDEMESEKLICSFNSKFMVSAVIFEGQTLDRIDSLLSVNHEGLSIWTGIIIRMLKLLHEAANRDNRGWMSPPDSHDARKTHSILWDPFKKI